MLSCFCFLLTLASSAGADPGPLLDKIASAYGGRAAMEKVSVVRESGHVEPAMPMGSSGPVVRVFARPLKLRVEIGDHPGSNEVRLIDGPKGWRNGKAAAGPAYDAMLLQALRLDFPFQLLTHRKAVVEREAMNYAGKRVRVLELSLTNGLSLTARVDPENGRILFSSGVSANGPAGPMSFETAYEDFRTVDGILFAFKETNFAGGMKTADTTLSRIELLKAPPEGAFRP